MITKDKRLNEIVNDNPKTMELFNDLNIDYCCAGNDTLEVAADKSSIDVDSLIKLIDKQVKIIREEKDTDFNDIDVFKTYSIENMISELIYSHHNNERKMLFELDGLVNKILSAHYKNHAEELIELHKLFGSLKTELEAHFVKEEKLIFPLMENNLQPTKEIVDYINILEGEHEIAGDIIKSIQDLTHNFQLPEDACMTYRRTYSLMDELFKDVFVHIFKENSILFPKYEKLAN